MQILGKRSKLLLIAVAIAMLVAIGVSFAAWDVTVVKATNANSSTYANAKVGDIIEFGEYYQDIDKKDILTNEYKKTPIQWIVVDKDERTGQLTLLSKYILACGSYFGNWYDDGTGYNWNYNKTKKEDATYTYSTAEVGGNPYNQAYVDSTARAFLNNLERLDMGGDTFDVTLGYIPSGINSTSDKELLSSVGFSNQIYWTGYNSLTVPTLEGKSGIFKRPDKLYTIENEEYQEFYYQRPITSDEYKARPVTRGFLDEAFTDELKSMIVPKQIAGYTGHRWPDSAHNIATKSYIEGSADKVWLPSATELNVMNGYPWYYEPDVPATHEFDEWTNPSDEAGSTVFEYFKNLEGEALMKALKTTRTTIAANGKIGNYSIPLYDKGTTTEKKDISESANTSDYYWTRSPSSYWYYSARLVLASGLFNRHTTHNSNVGVRPCVILKY